MLKKVVGPMVTFALGDGGGNGGGGGEGAGTLHSADAGACETVADNGDE